MLTTDTAYGITCDVCSTRLDLATRGIDTTILAQPTVRRLARKLDWATFSRADKDICRSCVTSESGRQQMAAFASDADDDSEGSGAGTTGPRIAPSEDPGGEPAEIKPSGEDVPDGTEPEYERQNSDEEFPGEPKGTPGEGEQDSRAFARLEGAAV